MCVPKFAVDENLAARRERSLGNPNFTHQSLRAGHDFVGPRLQTQCS